MMPQFANKWNLVKKYKNIAKGIFIFSIGLFKKVVIADSFAIWATNGFDKAEYLNMIEAWATSLSYTFQLYFDFSGYTDMAIGAALLFNIKLPINFNSPYKAVSIQDFWRRWHITLSHFLRDYIYIPLGGNRKGEFRTYTNLMITFLLGGLWHGAGWTFVFWGFLHGIALVVHRAWQKLKIKLPKILAWFITFNFINISWVFFRAKEWDDAIKVLKGMFGGDLVVSKSFLSGIEFLKYSDVWLGNIFADKYLMWELLGAFIVVLAFKNSIYFLKNIRFNIYTVLVCSFLLIVSFLNLKGVHEFLYFNF
jgi:D-alanyl-lipoteichoic acid acyltransferase DltB (MBOAT superfamily)